MNSFFVAVFCACLSIVSAVNLVSHQFDAYQQFIDLSVNNFDNKPDSVYTYTLTARPRAKVSIYFLTATTNNCIIELFDGGEANGFRVNTAKLDHIINQAGQIIPIKFTSATDNYFLRVTALPNAGADFQAIATDFINYDDCSSTFVYAVGTQFIYPTVYLSKPAISCIHILRVVDTTNNRGMTMNIQNYTKGNFEGNMYKGLMMVPENKLESLDYFYVTDRNVVVETTNTAKFTITYHLQDLSAKCAIGLQAGLKHDVMTVDYIPYRTMNGVTEQTFSVLGQDDVKRMQVTFLNKIGSANIQINAIKKGAQPVVYNYTQSTLPTTPFALDAEELLIQYTGDAATAKGLYALVADATARTGQPTNAPGGNNGNTQKPTNGPGNNNGDNNGGKKDNAVSNLFNLVTILVFILFFKL